MLYHAFTHCEAIQYQFFKGEECAFKHSNTTSGKSWKKQICFGVLASSNSIRRLDEQKTGGSALIIGAMKTNEVGYQFF
jgi:hypothetical protein